MGKDTPSLFNPASILLRFTLIQGRVIVLKTVNRGICQNHRIAYMHSHILKCMWFQIMVTN
jgi:hypothetical protein